MPELRKQQRAIEAELQSLEMTAVDQTRNLRLVETLAEFRTRLRARGNVLEVTERQRVVRLLVEEILVGGDNITIRHSIPMPASSPDSNHGVRSSREPLRAQYWLMLPFAFKSLARACSGDMQAIVPSVDPGLVRFCSSMVAVIVFDRLW